MGRTTTGAIALVALVALTGCGAGGDPQSGGATHTMPDGTEMEGETHIHDDGHDHGRSGAEQARPSAAAEMVCAGQVVDDVTRIMGLDEDTEPSPTWRAPMYTCTFDLDAGPLVLAVHDADRRAAGMAHFQQLRTGHRDATPLQGVYSLGLPAYETAGGTVAFVRDGKTLEVDATGLSGRLGVEGDMSRTEIAYAVATSVLACWTEHG